MALAKTVAYTPFNKTSFGYGSGEIAAAHNSLTNVKIIITKTSGNWDETGHISTKGSGGAIPSYNKSQFEWSVEGTKADVDAVLDALDFFPADYPAIRTWTTTATKPNATNGTYANENPADTVPIPDTVFSLKVYNPDSSYALVSTNAVTFDATQPTFGKVRPFWSTAPTDQDLSTSAHSAVSGGLVNMGVIAQGSDTDPLTVTCEFRNYGTTTQYTGSAYGQFTPADKQFIGDKKSGTINTTNNRINFTGTKAEVQSFLNNVRYYRQSNKLAFDMFFTLSNGVVGSTLTKSVWYSDNVIGLTTVPGQSFIEDTAASWDFGALTTSSIPADVDVFAATITVPTAAASNITSSTAGITQSYTAGTGVYLVSHSSEATLLTALRNITFTPETDYAEATTNMTVQLTYTGSAISSSYTSASQTVVVSGTGVEEMGNTSTAHTYSEDNAYSFNTGTVPQIVHNANNNFTVTFTMGAATGRLEAPSGAATLTNVGNGVFTLAGTRNNVNADLLILKYIPATDFSGNHTISFSSIRTSGGGSPPTTTGSFTMTGIEVGELSISQLIDQAWDEDVTQLFDSGLQITDTADEVEGGAAFGSPYIIACEMYNAGGSIYTDGTLQVATASQGSLSISATNGQGGNGAFGGNALTISGTKAEVNTALQNLEFVPDANFEGAGPWIYYYIKRVTDNVYLTPIGGTGFSYPPEVVSKFLSASNTAEASISQKTLTWEENVTKQFDSGIAILDKATENTSYTNSPTAFFGTEYKLETWMTDSIANSTANYFTHGVLNTATPGTMTLTGTGASGSSLTMTGSKLEINNALASMKFIPDIDYFGAGPVVWYKVTRVYDSEVTIPFVSSTTTSFSTNTATSNFAITVPSNIAWNEDQIESLSFNSGIVINDKATENPDHASYFNTTFEIEARAKHYKVLTAGSFDTGTPHTIVTVGNTDFTAIGASANTVGVNFTPTGVGSGTGTASASQPMNDAVWNCTNNGGATVTGIGTNASRLNITGTKAQVNIAVANMKMIPNLDMTTPTDHLPAANSFWFEYKISRKHDSLIYNHYASGSTNFNLGTAIDPYFTTVSPDTMAYNEDTSTTIFAGKDVGITETATADPLYPGNAVTYQVEVEISPNADGQWGTTGSSTYVTAVGNAEDVNAELKALVFTPTLDSSNNPSILYKQTRYLAGGATVVQADGTVNIGTVTGTPVIPYVTTVLPAMAFLERTIVSPFSGKTIGITETVNPIYSATYTVELECTPSSDAKFTSNNSDKIILTGTKAAVNAAIEALQVTPIADTNINFDILYSQTRHITGLADVVQATDVNIGTATGTDYPEFRYGTANQNIQYFVNVEYISGVDTTLFNQIMEVEILAQLQSYSTWQHFDYEKMSLTLSSADVLLTPKQLAKNKGVPYERPITILDEAVGAQYKIIFSGGSLDAAKLIIEDTGWGTKEDIHALLDNGIYVNGKKSAHHNTNYTANFTLHKKVYTGAETQIANGHLTYKFQSGIELWSVAQENSTTAYQKRPDWPIYGANTLSSKTSWEKSWHDYTYYGVNPFSNQGFEKTGYANDLRYNFYNYRYNLSGINPNTGIQESVTPIGSARKETNDKGTSLFNVYQTTQPYHGKLTYADTDLSFFAMPTPKPYGGTTVSNATFDGTSRLSTTLQFPYFLIYPTLWNKWGVKITVPISYDSLMWPYNYKA